MVETARARKIHGKKCTIYGINHFTSPFPLQTRCIAKSNPPAISWFNKKTQDNLAAVASTFFIRLSFSWRIETHNYVDVCIIHALGQMLTSPLMILT